MIEIRNQPLVSIGLPTYNRPELLMRALDSLLSQTHKNLEIIISDNASPDIRVEEVAKSYCNKDKRVQYIKRNENIGAIRNFWSVLSFCSGEYFMWAADDDEWENDFIEFCLKNIGIAGTIMCDIETVYQPSGSSIASYMPKLSPNKSAYTNAIEYLNNMQPSIIYGLHRIEVIRSCITDKVFDFFDCLIVYRILLRFGIQTCSGIRYRAGVQGDAYEVKFSDESQKKLKYSTLIKEIINETLKSKKLDLIQKLKLCILALRIVFRIYSHLKINA